MTVPLPEEPYDVVIGEGAFEHLAEILSTQCPASRFALVADAPVARLYGERVLHAATAVAPTELLTFPAGEWNKSRESWGDLTDLLLRQRFDDDAAVLTLGGGVAGDLGGFVAATYRHGIRCIHLPTTLLAMTDSAVSGRTGLDSPVGRGRVGVLRHPTAVVADLATLATLPSVHVAAGMAAAIRNAVVADANYLATLVRHAPEIRRRAPEAILETVRRSVEIRRDLAVERHGSTGGHATLEFGDTIGRAIGWLLGYEMLHGEALAVGMLAEAGIGVQAGVTDADTAAQLRVAIETFGLPYGPASPIDISRLMGPLIEGSDDDRGTVRFALLSHTGEAARGDGNRGGISIAPATVEAALRDLAW